MVADQGSDTNVSRDHALLRMIRTEFRESDLKGYINIAANTFIQYKPSVNEIQHIAAAKGLKYGVDESILASIVAKKIEEQWIEVAWGKPVTEGKDGSIDFKFKTAADGPLKTDNEGRVNLKELNKIDNVVKDQLLAVHVPPVYGQPGISVKRISIHPRRVQDVKLFSGKNTYLSDDKNNLFASCDGMVVIRKNHVEVDPVYFVTGDVGPATGNIHFVGSVIIQGSVLDGYTVKAADDIAIKGTLGAATIESGKSVIISGGFAGKDQGSITAERVEALFVNQGTISANEECVIHDSVMHSRIYTGGFLKVEDGRGTLLGGQTVATRGVVAQVIGGEAEPRTVIECGLPFEICARFMQIEKEFIKYRRNFIEAEKNIAILENLEQQGKLDDDKMKLLDSLLGLRKKCNQEILSLTVETRMLAQKIDEPYPAVVTCQKVFPGCEFFAPKNIVKVENQQSPFFLKIANGVFTNRE